MTEPTSSRASATPPSAPEEMSVRLIIAWGIVLIPLAWGVYETAVKAMALFQ